MSTSPETIAILQGPCHYCGNYHVGICPRIKSIEYYENGAVKNVELHNTDYYRSGEATSWGTTRVVVDYDGTIENVDSESQEKHTI